MLDQCFPEGLHPMEGSHAGAVHEELRLEKFVKGFFLWEHGRSVSNLPSVEEGGRARM